MPLTLTPCHLVGCYELTPKIFHDERGRFVKTYQAEVFRQQGWATDWRETYYSVSRQGVLRGLHFQTPPQDHAKLVYCTAGTVLDAVVDLRRGSPTFGGHQLLELSAEKANMLYLPKGMAHGFYVTSATATVHYQVTTVYAPACDAGIRWDSVGIPWPATAPLLSERDRHLPAWRHFDSPFVFAPPEGA